MLEPDVRRRLWAIIFFGFTAATSVDVRGAEPWSWKVANARGTALALVGQQWQVIYPGDPVSSGQPFRTLRSGRLQLSDGPDSIEFSGNSAAQVSDENGTVVITQYAGELTINSVADTTGQIVVEASTLSINLAAGTFSTVVGEGRTEVHVKEGAASVLDRATGHQVILAAGQSVTGLPDGDLKVAGPGTLPEVTDATGEVVVEATSTEANNSNGKASGNSNGNAANSDGNSGGSSNGNTGGNGSGNSSGNGNSGTSGSSRGNGKS